jgi:uncharacterized protein (TIGR03437 family)
LKPETRQTFRLVADRLFQWVCAFPFLVLVAPLQAQNPQTEQQFIAATIAAIEAFQGTLPPPANKVVFGGNLAPAQGGLIGGQPLNVLLQYVEGMKAAGCQRVDLNPGVTSINHRAIAAMYDAIVTHIRELGMQLAINPTVLNGELGANPTFQDFQNAAMTAYPALAARYHPDNFVIVHEPTTMDARLGIVTTTGQWDGFIRAVAPLVKTASPHTRLGAGDFYSAAENTYFEDFVTIPVLDFMTMDIYDDNKFPQLDAWVKLAHTAVDPTHPKGKGIYVEETWVPKYLPIPLPAGWQSNPGGTDALALVGDCDVAFAPMDAVWLQAMSTWASDAGMEALTAYTTEAFFTYGSSGSDKPSQASYVGTVLQAVQNGQLTTAGQAYLQARTQLGIPEVTSLSSASYASIPSVFTPNCGSADDPCDALTVVAPGELVSAFGADLATTTLGDGGFPLNLAGTTATLVDSSNTGYPVPLFFVSPYQVNYYVPAAVLAGPATLTVTSGDGTQTGGWLLVQPVMPGLYTADQNGRGPASAQAVVVHADGSQSHQATYSCSSGSCQPAPITLATTDALYIELYGTGIRNVSGLSAVTATANGQSAPVQYAGASSYKGEDQVNIQIPVSLFNGGLVNIVLTVGGQTANTVTIELD